MILALDIKILGDISKYYFPKGGDLKDKIRESFPHGNVEMSL